MKSIFSQWVGWGWIAIVLYLFVVQSGIRYRPPGILGDLVKAFFDSMTAAYLQ